MSSAKTGRTKIRRLKTARFVRARVVVLHVRAAVAFAENVARPIAFHDAAGDLRDSHVRIALAVGEHVAAGLAVVAIIVCTMTAAGTALGGVPVAVDVVAKALFVAEAVAGIMGTFPPAADVGVVGTGIRAIGVDLATKGGVGAAAFRPR